MSQSAACRYPDVAQALRNWLTSQEQFINGPEVAAAIGISPKKLALVRDGRALPRGQEGQRFFEITGLACFGPKEQARREEQHKRNKRRYLKNYYQEHREEQLAQQKARRAKDRNRLRKNKQSWNQTRHRRITPEELKLLQDASGKRFWMACPKLGEKVTILTTVLTDRDIVCLECGVILERLNQHLHNVHGFRAKEYRRKWGYNKKSPLCSAQFSQGMSKLKKKAGIVPPQDTRFGEPLGPSWQKGVKARQKGGFSMEAIEKFRARMKGKSFPDRQIIKDWEIARLALQGFSPSKIANRVRLAPSAAGARLRRIGFPTFRAGPLLFRHGEPMTSQHLFETCDDFGLKRSKLADLMGIPGPNLSRRLNRYALDMPLPLTWAKQLLRVRRQLREQRPLKPSSPKGGRPRELLPSEEKQIRRQYRKLVSDLLQLRKWSENFDEDVGAKARLRHVWSWLCEQRRLGKIQVLLFWPQFFDWLQKTFRQPYRQGKSTAKLGKPLTLEFLADSFHVSPGTIIKIVWPSSR